MNAEQRVRAAWPDAQVAEAPFDAFIGRRVWIESRKANKMLSGWLNKTPAAAWADAASRLQRGMRAKKEEHDV